MTEIITNFQNLTQKYHQGASSTIGNQKITISPKYFDSKDGKLFYHQNINLETYMSSSELSSNNDKNYSNQLTSIQEQGQVIPKQVLIDIEKHLSETVYFNQNIQNVKFKYSSISIFRDDISEILKSHGQFFTLRGSNYTNSNFTFYCTFHEPKQSKKNIQKRQKVYKSPGSEFKCEAFLQFQRKQIAPQQYKFSLSDFNIFHTHTSTQTALFRTIATKSQKEIIQKSFHDKAGDVRIKLGANHNLRSSQLSYQRQLGKAKFEKQKSNNLNNIYGLFHVTYQKNQKDIYDCLFVNQNIKVSELSSNNFAIIDATNGLCIEKFPVEIISISSSSYRYVIAAAMVMTDETIQSYEKMLRLFKSHFPNIFIFLGDRSHSQMAAFQKVYEDKGKYFYCRRHLLANIKDHAKHFYSLFIDFLINHTINSTIFEQLVSEMSQYTNEFKYVMELISQKDKWYPEAYLLAGIIDNNTSNPAEGGFGILKQNNTFPQEIPILFETISLRAINQIQEIIRYYTIDSQEFKDSCDMICSYFPCLSPIINEFGQRGIDYYLYEIYLLTDRSVKINSSEPYSFEHHNQSLFNPSLCPYCYQQDFYSHNQNNPIFIQYPPCRHVLTSSTAIDISSIPTIYLKPKISDNYNFNQLESSIQNRPEIVSQKIVIDTIASIANNYQQDTNVTRSICTSILQGRPKVHIRENVRNQISKIKQRNKRYCPPQKREYPL